MSVGHEEESLRIGLLKLRDIDSVAVLEEEAFPDDPWSAPMVIEELASEYGVYLGAWINQTLVGYGGVKGVEDFDLMTLGVSPQWRRRGIGEKLLAELLDAVKERGGKQVFLEVRQSNTSAIELYLKRGFEEVGKVRDYYRFPTEDALTMRIVLTS